MGLSFRLGGWRGRDDGRYPLKTALSRGQRVARCMLSLRVHTAQWIEGEKLSISKADNVGELVSLGTVAYLTQLLGTGLFHADPHPGNLIRTTTGQLAILDFGLMTEIDDEQVKWRQDIG